MRTKAFLLAAGFAALVSCSNDKGEDAKVLSSQTTGTADVKQLSASFNEAWNKKDSAAVMQLMADEVVLLSGRDKCSGKKEVADKWLHNNLPVTSNLQTQELQQNTGSTLAYSAGTWTLDVTPPGQQMMHASGNHTFIWKKQSDESWKISLINIEDHDPEQQTEAKK